MGLFQTVLGLSIFFGSSAFGFLLQAFGRQSFLAGALLAAVTFAYYNFISTG